MKDSILKIEEVAGKIESKLTSLKRIDSLTLRFKEIGDILDHADHNSNKVYFLTFAGKYGLTLVHNLQTLLLEKDKYVNDVDPKKITCRDFYNHYMVPLRSERDSRYNQVENSAKRLSDWKLRLNIRIKIF